MDRKDLYEVDQFAKQASADLESFIAYRVSQHPQAVSRSSGNTDSLAADIGLRLVKGVF
jgi:hypothetical protein